MLLALVYYMLVNCEGAEPALTSFRVALLHEASSRYLTLHVQCQQLQGQTRIHTRRNAPQPRNSPVDPARHASRQCECWRVEQSDKSWRLLCSRESITCMKKQKHRLISLLLVLGCGL